MGVSIKFKVKDNSGGEAWSDELVTASEVFVELKSSIKSMASLAKGEIGTIELWAAGGNGDVPMPYSYRCVTFQQIDSGITATVQKGDHGVVEERYEKERGKTPLDMEYHKIEEWPLYLQYSFFRVKVEAKYEPVS